MPRAKSAKVEAAVEVVNSPACVDPANIPDGYTLIPVGKVESNHTVEGTGQRTEDGRFELCKRK